MKLLRQILAAVVVLIVLSASEVQGNVAKAKVVAESNGANVSGKAKATTDGKGGDAIAELKVKGEKGGTASGDVTAISKDGGDAKASLAVAAADGATVDSKVIVIAEEDGATAVLDKVVAAKGNIDVATVSVKQAIGVGNGVIVALLLDKAFLNGRLVQNEVKEVVYFSIIKAIDDSSVDRHALSSFLFRAITSPKGEPLVFVKILARLVKERGCAYIFPVLREAELLSVADGKNDLMLSAIYNELVLVRCVYPACLAHEPCCSMNRIKSNFCELCPVDGLCQYQTYGDGYTNVLKTKPDENGIVSKCACPI